MQKKHFQKALTMLLAVVMILGMLPATVCAVDLAEEPTNEQQARTKRPLCRRTNPMQKQRRRNPRRNRRTKRPLCRRTNPVQKHRRKPPLKQQPRRKARRRLLQSNP